MSRAKSFSMYFMFVDLFVGFVFGSIGHFFGLLIFPLLAIVRGSVVGIYVNDINFAKKIGVSGFFGGLSYLIGVMLGVFNLMFILTPRYDVFQNTLGDLLESNFNIHSSIVGSLFCSIGYLFAYYLIALFAGLLARKVEKHI